MILTPDGAQKMIKRLEQDKKQLEDKMNNLSKYTVSISEGDPEQLKPEFDFRETFENIEAINNKIIKIKHAKNVFNTTTIVPDTEKTVDVCLLEMSNINNDSNRYIRMGNAMPKERSYGGYNDVEYTYTNYDINMAKDIGDDMLSRLYLIQEKLNLVNSTYTFEVDL